MGRLSGDWIILPTSSATTRGEATGMQRCGDGAHHHDDLWGPPPPHEVAHHWFGDYVTLADWPEIWLNRGFASYGEVIWYEDYYGETGRRAVHRKPD